MKYILITKRIIIDGRELNEAFRDSMWFKDLSIGSEYYIEEDTGIYFLKQEYPLTTILLTHLEVKLYFKPLTEHRTERLREIGI